MSPAKTSKGSLGRNSTSRSSGRLDAKTAGKISRESAASREKIEAEKAQAKVSLQANRRNVSVAWLRQRKELLLRAIDGSNTCVIGLKVVGLEQLMELGFSVSEQAIFAADVHSIPLAKPHRQLARNTDTNELLDRRITNTSSLANHFSVRWESNVTVSPWLDDKQFSAKGLAWISGVAGQKLLDEISKAIQRTAAQGESNVTLVMEKTKEQWSIRPLGRLWRPAPPPAILRELTKLRGFSCVVSYLSERSANLSIFWS